MLSNGIQAVTLKRRKQVFIAAFNQSKEGISTHFDFSTAFVAWWSQKLFETILAVEIAFLFNESNVLKWTTAISIDAYKVIWTPDTSQCCYKWSSVSFEMFNRENIRIRIMKNRTREPGFYRIFTLETAIRIFKHNRNHSKCKILISTSVEEEINSKSINSKHGHKKIIFKK